MSHQELRNIDAPVDELVYHPVNAIVAQIIDQLRSEVGDKYPPFGQDDASIEEALVPSTPPYVASTVHGNYLIIISLVQKMMLGMEAIEVYLNTNNNENRLGCQSDIVVDIKESIGTPSVEDV